MRLQGVIFDLDGTLADTLPICVRAFQDTLLQFTGRRYAEAEIIAQFGATEEGMLERLVPDRTTQSLRTFLEAYERAHTGCTAPFPGITDALRLLTTRGVRLAIVTGKGPETADISLRYIGLDHLFPVVETGSADGPIKAQSIRRVLGIWGAEPRGVVYVGDTPYDMRYARETGVMALGAAWAETATVLHDDGLADAVFASVDEFIRWIDGAIGPEAVECLPRSSAGTEATRLEGRNKRR